MNQTRIKSFDVARGLCLCFMIVVHAFSYWERYPEFNRFTGPFFLVFFFYSSGIFSTFEKTGSQIKRLFFELEVPYFVFTTYYIFYCCFIGQYFPDFSTIGKLKLGCASLVYALPSSLNNVLLFHCSTIGIGPIWFLNCFFFSKATPHKIET